MLNCDWAQALTRYECRQVTDLHGGAALEIATPFTLIDGSPVVLYLVDQGTHLLISDNGDTLAHLSGVGLDVWNGNRLRTLRDRAAPHGITLDPAGDLRCLATPEHAAFVFAKAVGGVLAVGDWAAGVLAREKPERDLAAEAEPYIVARNPAWQLEHRKRVLGASNTEYLFDIRHGPDLIDVIAPSAQGTGGAMRKAGDVQNGPCAGVFAPLIVVDDRTDPETAMQEIRIMASVTRAMAFSALMGRPATIQ